MIRKAMQLNDGTVGPEVLVSDIVLNAMVAYVQKHLAEATDTDEMAYWGDQLAALERRRVVWELGQGPPNSIIREKD